MSLAKLPKWNVRKTTFTVFLCTQTCKYLVPIYCKLMRCLVWYIYINLQTIPEHQSTSDAGRAGLQTDTNRYKTLISAQRFSRRIQEGATQRNDRWEKELMQKLWISAPSFLLPRGQSNNWRRLLLQYVDWIHLVYPAQASQGTSWDIITGVYVMVPCCPMSLWHQNHLALLLFFLILLLCQYLPIFGAFATLETPLISDQDWLHAGLPLCCSYLLFYLL